MSFFSDFVKAFNDKKTDALIARNRKLKKEAKADFKAARRYTREADKARNKGKKLMNRYVADSKRIDSRLRRFFQ